MSAENPQSVVLEAWQAPDLRAVESGPLSEEEISLHPTFENTVKVVERVGAVAIVQSVHNGLRNPYYEHDIILKDVFNNPNKVGTQGCMWVQADILGDYKSEPELSPKPKVEPINPIAKAWQAIDRNKQIADKVTYGVIHRVDTAVYDKAPKELGRDVRVALGKLAELRELDRDGYELVMNSYFRLPRRIEPVITKPAKQTQAA